MWQAGEGGRDCRCVANGLQEVDVGRQRLGGVTDHEFAGQGQELLRHVGAEAAARTGGDQDGGDVAWPAPSPGGAREVNWRVVCGQ